jgi:hypothetical protein
MHLLARATAPLVVPSFVHSIFGSGIFIVAAALLVILHLSFFLHTRQLQPRQ